MEEHEQAGVDQPSANGNEPAGSTSGGRSAGSHAQDNSSHRHVDELTQAYERARRELNEAVKSLREEVSNIDIDRARSRAKGWVEENPALAVMLGVGAGIVSGRLLSSAFRSEPASLTDRARHQADELRGRAGDYADELGEALAVQLRRAAASVDDVGDFVSKRGGDMTDRARDLGEEISARAREAGETISRRAEKTGKDVSRRAGNVSKDASRRADEIADSLEDTTARSVRALEDAADELSKTLKKRSKKARKGAKKRVDRGHDFSNTVVNAARTAVAAVVVKKVNDWLRALR